jgi:hypothetical protein
MNIGYRSHFRVLPILLAIFLTFTGSMSFARDSVPLPARVQVAWAPTEQLSEVKDNQMGRGWLRPEDWMKSLGNYLRVRADRILPPGQQLQVTINDIKLAGDFEPWRHPAAQDIRFLTDLYPPRIDLHFKLVASDGTTIREGDGRLRDMSYLQRAIQTSTDPLRYDKRLIDDWLRREFAKQS